LKSRGNQFIVHGVGRKSFLKYKTELDVDAKEMIAKFEQAKCYIEEGQFNDDKLHGFGRSIRGDLQTTEVGYFQNRTLNGYGKSTLAAK